MNYFNCDKFRVSRKTKINIRSVNHEDIAELEATETYTD